jgi:2Fe-2S ferredoxin
MNTIRIRFFRHDLTETTIDATTDQSLMKAAVDANVGGIEADCGGVLTCATCHVMVDAPWVDHLPKPVADETDMLDFAASPVLANSRLSCQIKLTPALDGMVVRLPPSQH